MRNECHLFLDFLFDALKLALQLKRDLCFISLQLSDVFVIQMAYNAHDECKIICIPNLLSHCAIQHQENFSRFLE